MSGQEPIPMPEREAELAIGDDDRPLRDLDDHHDREELRTRYYNLLQELRVIIPGVQVLLGFLLTAPFAERFSNLDQAGRVLYGLTLLSALLSVVCLLTPTVLHRIGERTARRARLTWSIRLTVAGLVALAVALVLGLTCVSRLVFEAAATTVLVASAAVVLTVLWGWLPMRLSHLEDELTRSGGTSPRSRTTSG
jgi:cation transport ATPase